jgi:hypothetical protein
VAVITALTMPRQEPSNHAVASEAGSADAPTTSDIDRDGEVAATGSPEPAIARP